MQLLEAAVTLTLLAATPAPAQDLVAQRADSAYAAPAGDLGPTTAPPWNPPRAIARRRMWEQVILFPQRVVTLPLTGLGMLTESALLPLEESGLLEIRRDEKTPPKPIRVRVGPPGISDGGGLGARAEVSADLFRAALRSDIHVSHAATLRHYHDTRVGIQWLGGGLEYQNTWRPQDRFYGIGTGTSEGDLSRHATHHEHLYTNFIHAWNHRVPDGDPRTWFSIWIGPRRTTIRSGRDIDDPSIEQRFPGEVASTIDRRLAHLVYGTRFASDWRLGQPHWGHGWRVLIEAQRFDAARGALALGMTGEPIAQFTRTTVELETGVSFMRDPRTLRLMGRVVDQGVTAGREHMAVSDLASLGGRSGLSGFPPGRFHDLDLALVRLTYLFPIVRRLEIDLHAESGAVFASLWDDARLSRFRQSFGIALRGRATGYPLGAIGLDFSSEGTRLRYSLGNPDR